MLLTREDGLFIATTLRPCLPLRKEDHIHLLFERRRCPATAPVGGGGSMVNTFVSQFSTYAVNVQSKEKPKEETTCSRCKGSLGTVRYLLQDFKGFSSLASAQENKNSFFCRLTIFLFCFLLPLFSTRNQKKPPYFNLCYL